MSNSETDKNQIEQVIRDSIGWALTKDIDLLYRSLAQDDDFFIYHPDNASTICGFDAFKVHAENIFMTDAFKAISFELRELRIVLSKSGGVAWFSCVLDDFGEWQGKPINWENVRWTGVLEQRDDRWQIAQMHFSFASDAESEKA